MIWPQKNFPQKIFLFHTHLQLSNEAKNKILITTKVMGLLALSESLLNIYS